MVESSAQNVVSGAPRAGGPRVLELRVHGIRNTAPHDLIGCKQDQIEPAGDSDSLSGFWTEKSPPAGSPTRVEAYSWGNLARSSPSSSFLKGVGRVFGQALWFLVVPFALANAAYWARKLPEPGTRRRILAAGTGAGTVRLFALLLSLLYTTTFCALAFGLFAVECFPSAASGKPIAMCKQLPEALDFMTGWSRGPRLALAALVPIAAILAVFVTAKLAQVRNLAPARVRWNEEAPATARARRGAAGRPFLASPGLWTRPHVSPSTGRMHIAACLALVCVLLLSDNIEALWPAECQTVAKRLEVGCIQELGQAVIRDGFAGLLLLASVLLLLASVLSVIFLCPEVRARADHGWGNAWSHGLWISGVLLVVATAGQLILGSVVEAVPDMDRAFAGTSVASLILLTALVILAVAGLFMRRGLVFHAVIGASALSSAVLILWAIGTWGDLVLIIPSFISVVLLVAYFLPGARRRAEDEGWYGRGPGIFMFAAILVAFFLSSALVLGTRKFLEWPMDKELPAEPSELWRGPQGAGVAVAESLNVPQVYAATGGLLLYGIGLAVVGILPACAWLMLKRGLKPMQPPSYSGPGPLPPQPPSYFSDIDVDHRHQGEGPGRRRQELAYRRRRLSALTQRGEAAFGLLTLLIWAAAVLAIATAALRNSDTGTSIIRDWLRAAANSIQGDSSGWGIIMAATVILAFMVMNAATSVEERPLAVVWDIMCFLPNAAHPFGAPSYSNRVVPELARRISDWIDSPACARRKYKVLVSAHSLGAVVSIAAIFHLRACRPDLKFNRIRLLTYGVQLRPYFGRFFPELFGPAVLGTCPTHGPGLFSVDPWAKARKKEHARPGAGGMTLMALLRGPSVGKATPPVWKNIWRRTDYLGFPAYAHRTAGNDLDVYAVETEPRRSQFVVATHGNYTATSTYATVRGDMLADWPG